MSCIRFGKAAFVLAIAASAGVAMARPAWTEVGDAGYIFDGTGAQLTVGSGAISSISGSTSAPGATTYNELMDAYVIQIKDPVSFRATTNSAIDPVASVVGAGDFAGTDTRLWLFNLAGQPMLLNDDSGTGVQSIITAPGSFATSGAGGIVTARAAAQTIVAGQNYILVVGGYSAATGHNNGDGTYANTMEQPAIDSPSFDDLVGPLLGAPTSDTCIGTGAANTFNYTVALRGASFASGGAVPEPSSLALVGLAGLAVTRRRRSHRQ